MPALLLLLFLLLVIRFLNILLEIRYNAFSSTRLIVCSSCNYWGSTFRISKSLETSEGGRRWILRIKPSHSQ